MDDRAMILPSTLLQNQTFPSRSIAANRLMVDAAMSGRRSTVLIGEPGTGKSRVLVEALRAMPAPLDPMLLKPIPPPYSYITFLTHLLHEICLHRNVDLEKINPLDEKGFAVTSDHIPLREMLTEILDASSPLILCIDDFDQLLRGSPVDEASRILALANYLAEQNDLPITLILAFSRIPVSLRRSYPSTLLTSSEIIELLPVTAPELVDLLNVFSNLRIGSDQSVAERLIQLSGGRPDLIWLLLDHLWSLRNSSNNPGALNAGMLNDTTLSDPSLFHKASTLFESLYDHYFVPDEQKQIMLLLAAPEYRNGLPLDRLTVLDPAHQEAATDLMDRKYLEITEDADDRIDDEDGPENDSEANNDTPKAKPQKFYRLLIGYLGHWLRIWPRYDIEQQKHNMRDIDRRIYRLIEPWHELPPFVVVDEDMLRDYNLRP